MPLVGDPVCRPDGEAFEQRGWRLEKGAVATVEAVDSSGDFQLRNAAGKVSKWQYRRFYVYAERKRRVSDAKAAVASKAVAAAVSTTAASESAVIEYGEIWP